MTRRLLPALAAVLVAALNSCAEPAATLGDPALDAGRETYGRLCSTCHGPSGEGVSGPALTDVVATFPECEDHQVWVTLGSMEWENQFGPIYGATNKEITAIMPSFKNVLSEAEIAEVASFERFQFGGLSATEAVAGCGAD
ncbi:MAG TPA: cytochrome c [Acidimicrobiia bacterium]|nr:cytochrome c [Acidimicrobiia bacterium]